MKVAMVCPYDLSVPGGVQSQVKGLAEALGRSGATVAIVAPVTLTGAAERGSAAERGADRGAVRVIGIGKSVSVAANGSRAPVAPGPGAMRRTVRALRDLQPDIVHVHEPLTPGASLAALLAGPRPIIGTFHRAGSDALYRIEGRLLRRASHRLAAAVAVSEAARATAAEVLGRAFGAMLVIPNGVDTRGTGPHEDEATPPKPDELVIVFVGRHEERKGLAVLLEAFDLLGSGWTGAPLRLVVIGDGPATPSLRQRFPSPVIEWRGAVGDGERAAALRAGDVFVAPSIGGESFGVVLLEAMAAGAPVVASDLPGYQLAAREAALFVPPGDARALAEALQALLVDAGARDRLRALGTAHVRDYSLEAIAEKYRGLYESIVTAPFLS